eukprot:gene12476-13649_t
MASLLGMDEAVRMFRDAREYLTPVLTSSAFLEKGMLTPEEFVQAGDHLIRTSPSWSWESGEASKLRPYLPNNKQYLITRGVPCYRRISTLEVDSFIEENVSFGDGKIGDGDGEEEWFHTHSNGACVVTGSDTAAPTAETSNKEDEYLDMEDESLALDEATQKLSIAEGSASNVMKVRRYDVSITYDNYYRTPRIWLFGYDESGSALEPVAIFEDVMTDYAKRTVTIDPHPHLTKPHASIHPCRHGPAMSKIIAALMESGTTPQVEQYLPIFLKFIQSVVPTIEYDYTMNAVVQGQKQSS